MNIFHHGQYLGPNLISDLIEHNDTSDIAGKGLIARAEIQKNTFLVAFGGTVMQYSRYKNLAIFTHDLPIQVDRRLFLGPKNEKSVIKGDHVNHSCDPNCGIYGPNYLISRRIIYSGEELCFDYRMSETLVGLKDCQCNTSACIKDVKSDGWKDPELQKLYGLFFSTYLLRKVLKDNSLVFNEKLFRREVSLGSQIKNLGKYYQK